MAGLWKYTILELGPVRHPENHTNTRSSGSANCKEFSAARFLRETDSADSRGDRRELLSCCARFQRSREIDHRNCKRPHHWSQGRRCSRRVRPSVTATPAQRGHLNYRTKTKDDKLLRSSSMFFRTKSGRFLVRSASTMTSQAWLPCSTGYREWLFLWRLVSKKISNILWKMYWTGLCGRLFAVRARPLPT